jgi:hypothetical protein
MATVLTYTTGTLTREQISGPQGSHINTLNITYHLGDGTTVQKIENTTIGILTALRNIEVNISLSNAKASFRFIDVEHENYTEMTTCKGLILYMKIKAPEHERCLYRERTASAEENALLAERTASIKKLISLRAETTPTYDQSRRPSEAYEEVTEQRDEEQTSEAHMDASVIAIATIPPNTTPLLRKRLPSKFPSKPPSTKTGRSRPSSPFQVSGLQNFSPF